MAHTNSMNGINFECTDLRALCFSALAWVAQSRHVNMLLVVFHPQTMQYPIPGSNPRPQSAADNVFYCSAKAVSKNAKRAIMCVNPYRDRSVLTTTSQDSTGLLLRAIGLVPVQEAQTSHY